MPWLHLAACNLAIDRALHPPVSVPWSPVLPDAMAEDLLPALPRPGSWCWAYSPAMTPPVWWRHSTVPLLPAGCNRRPPLVQSICPLRFLYSQTYRRPDSRAVRLAIALCSLGSRTGTRQSCWGRRSCQQAAIPARAAAWIAVKPSRVLRPRVVAAIDPQRCAAGQADPAICGSGSRLCLVQQDAHARSAFPSSSAARAERMRISGPPVHLKDAVPGGQVCRRDREAAVLHTARDAKGCSANQFDHRP